MSTLLYSNVRLYYLQMNSQYAFGFFFQFHSTLVHPCKCFKVSLLMNNIDYCGHDDDFRLLPQYFYNFSGVTDRGCNDGGKEQFCKFQSELSAVIQAKASKNWNSGQNNTIKQTGDNKIQP